MIIFIPLGIIASIFQIVILREFNFSIAKNELAFVIAVGFWIIFCSLGSIPRLSKILHKIPLGVLACASFSLSICLIHLAKSLIGLKYFEATSLGLALILSIISIGPTAFTIGLAFSHFVQAYLKTPQKQNNVYAKFFAFEAIGFFLGGIFFTFFLIDYPNPLIFSLLPLILLPAVQNHEQKIRQASLIIIIGITSFFSFSLILKQEFAPAKILANFGSAYGPMIATYQAKATTLFSAGSSLATSEDQSTNEEFIHISLSATDPFTSKDILFIGPGLFGQIEEIAQYKLRSLDCLQIDPLISNLAKNQLPGRLKNEINFIIADPRSYLKKVNKQYDAILMNMPPPANLALNRYFTEDFFKIISRRLKPKGVFSFAIPSKREILSPQFIRFDSSIINAIDKVFTNKFIIPADTMIILASDKRKINDYDLLNNFTQAKPKTSFFTIYHYQDYLAPGIRNYTQNMLDKTIPSNTDLAPSGFLNYLLLEQIKFYPGLKVDLRKMPFLIIILLLFSMALIAILSNLSKRTSCLLNIAMVGFNSISFSSIVFVLFQLYCGGLFWKLGILVAFFMAGLSLGTFLAGKIKTSNLNLLLFLYLFWAIMILVLLLNLKIIARLNYAELALYFYALLCGFLTGSAYPLFTQDLLKNEFNAKNLAMTIYSTDLIGAFLGTALSGMLLIPFLGIPSSLLTLILLNVFFVLKNLRA